MRLTKLDFVARLGSDAFEELLLMARQSVAVEKLVKLIDWATTDADGTSIDTEDPRVQEVRNLEPVLIALGKATQGWADSVLSSPEPVQVAAEQPVFVATHTVQDFGPAMIDADGTVRLADGRWTTLDALVAMNKTVEAI